MRELFWMRVLGLCNSETIVCSQTRHVAQAAFDIATCNDALTSRGLYKAAGNIFWLNMRRMTNASVPVYKSNIKKLMTAFFSSPDCYPYDVHVALDAKAKGDDILRNRGSLHRLSCEEVEMAYIMKVAERIRDGADNAELRLLVCSAPSSCFFCRCPAMQIQVSGAVWRSRRPWSSDVSPQRPGTCSPLTSVACFSLAMKR